jgi:hypothetical protein
VRGVGLNKTCYKIKCEVNCCYTISFTRDIDDETKIDIEGRNTPIKGSSLIGFNKI